LAFLLPLLVQFHSWWCCIFGCCAGGSGLLSNIPAVARPAALPGRTSWRRHVPFALFLVALSSLILGTARPFASVLVRCPRATIILALDVSWSMCASDIPPNRLTVAQEAAEKFILNQSQRRIGIVALLDLQS
jgi:hypothetical protein